MNIKTEIYLYLLIKVDNFTANLENRNLVSYWSQGNVKDYFNFRKNSNKVKLYLLHFLLFQNIAWKFTKIFEVCIPQKIKYIGPDKT